MVRIQWYTRDPGAITTDGRRQVWLFVRLQLFLSSWLPCHFLQSASSGRQFGGIPLPCQFILNYSHHILASVGCLGPYRPQQDAEQTVPEIYFQSFPKSRISISSHTYKANNQQVYSSGAATWDIEYTKHISSTPQHSPKTNHQIEIHWWVKNMTHNYRQSVISWLNRYFTDV